MNKKWICLALSLILTFSILAGCGGSEEVSETTAIQTEAPETEVPTLAPHTEPKTTEPEPSVTAPLKTEPPVTEAPTEAVQAENFDPASVPIYDGTPYAVVHDNTPYFVQGELTEQSFETYSNLDHLGRCGAAFACIGTDLMPTEERGEIGMIKPSGWHTVKYDCVSGKYLYNRCHLIGFQLSGENANEKNLITGTRYMNVDGMLPFENMVADFVHETENHVMYRVTPVYSGDNLVADGVLMEALSVEDQGDGITFCVFVYNVQPGVIIDYRTGESKADGSCTAETQASAASDNTPDTNEDESNEPDYILNTNSKKFHYPDCSSVDKMSEQNKKEYTGSREDLINQGYEPCKRCNP